MPKTCNLCIKYDISSGKDRLVYEDSFCHIVDNGTTNLDINGKIVFAKKRFSLVINKHKKHLTEKERSLVYSTLTDFMRRKFKLKENSDYFLKVTMNTYPNHYHLHAYIPPFTDKEKRL